MTPLALIGTGFRSADDVAKALKPFVRSIAPPLTPMQLEIAEHYKPHGHAKNGKVPLCDCGRPGVHKWGTYWECARCYALRAHSEHKGPPRKRRMRRRMRRNLGVHLSDYPPGEEGLRQYNRDYNRALRLALGHKRTKFVVDVHRYDYPDTPEGLAQYKHAYQAGWRAKNK